MKSSARILSIFAMVLALPAAAHAADPLDGDPSGWSKEQADQIRTKSAWVQTVEVLPAVLRGPDDTLSKPIGSARRVPIQVAWYSAGAYRHAYAKLFRDLSPSQLADMTGPQDRFYMILVTAPETLSVIDSVTEVELARATSLDVDGTSLPLAFVQGPKERRAPEAMFFFDRGAGIPAQARQAVFTTRARDFSAKAKFKLEKMTWRGARDLDGDTGALTDLEKTRRAIQAAVLGAGDAALARGVLSVRVETLEDKNRPFGAYVAYDPARDRIPGSEIGAADPLARKQGIAARLGTWSLANGSDLQALVFLDPVTQGAADYILGADAEKLSKMAPEGASAFFKQKLSRPDEKKSPDSKGSPRKPEGKPKKAGG